MTIETIKFSQMTDGGDLANNDKTPGLQDGANVLFNNPWTFLPPGTTAERPTPSSAINFRLRFNTTDQLYEYYDAVLGQWTQLQESAFTQGPFITYTADASLPDAQNLGALANGILKQSITLGSATLDIAVAGTDYWAPGNALTRNQPPVVGDDVTNKTYVDSLVSGVVISVQGTANQVLVNATSGTPQTGALTLTTPQDIAPESSPTFAGMTMTGDIDMGGFKAINAAEPTNPQDYATKNYVDQNALSGTSVYAASAASLGSVTQSGAGVGATLTNAGAQATFSLDGVNPPVGSDVLIKNTATGMTAANEGIYTVTDAGSGSSNWVLTRSVEYDTPTQINNTGLIIVQNGSTLAGTAWYNSATIVTVDTTNFNYVLFPASSGASNAKVTVITASGTFTRDANCLFAFIEGVGGGGGGGGITGGTVGQGAIGGCGAGGGYFKKKFTSAQIGATAAVVIGAGGAGGSSGGGTGGTGGSTTFTPAGTGGVLTATGGSGGVGMTESASAQLAGGGSPGSASGGDININSSYGSPGQTGASGLSLSQEGAGASYLSANTYPIYALGAGGGSGGANGGYGCGSNGRYSLQGSGSTGPGQPGAAGVCIITEYIV